MTIKCFEWDWCPEQIDFRLNGQTYSNAFGQQAHHVGPHFWSFSMKLPPMNDSKTREVESLLYCLEGTNVLCLYDPRRQWPKEFEPFFIDDGSPRTPEEHQEAVDAAQQAVDDYLALHTLQGAGSAMGPQGAGSTTGPQGAGGPSEYLALVDTLNETTAARDVADILDDIAELGTDIATVTAMSKADKTVTLEVGSGLTISVGDPIGFTDDTGFHHYFQAAETKISTGTPITVQVNPRPRKDLTGVSIDYDRFKPRCRFVVTMDDLETHNTREGRFTDISLKGREYWGALS